MTVTKGQAQNFANWLNSKHDSGMSFRAIAELFPAREDGSQIVKAGTLDRIAKSGGAYLPKEREILEAMGLIKPRKIRSWLPGERRTARIIGTMARELSRSIAAAWRS